MLGGGAWTGSVRRRTRRGGPGDRLPERPERRHAEDVALAGVDGDAVVALVEQVAEDPERRPARVRRRADDRDASGRPEHLAGGLGIEDRDGAAVLLEIEVG